MSDIREALLSHEVNRLRASLKWALERIRFPAVQDPTTPEDDHLWSGCPGCRVVWAREMQHKDGCEYLAALAEVKDDKTSS
jgi:hypothetical protein